jgi:hypothetical protein
MGNSTKFYFHIPFQNMNLHWLTCIQEFGVPLQVANKTWFNINQGTLLITSHIYYRNIVATIVTPGVSQGLCKLLSYVRS